MIISLKCEIGQVHLQSPATTPSRTCVLHDDILYKILVILFVLFFFWGGEGGRIISLKHKMHQVHLQSPMTTPSRTSVSAAL